MTRTQSFIIGVASFAAGVAIGLLFAPKSGKELRKDISDSAQNYLIFTRTSSYPNSRPVMSSAT